jgi:hypothetical protein
MIDVIDVNDELANRRMGREELRIDHSPLQPSVPRCLLVRANPSNVNRDQRTTACAKETAAKVLQSNETAVGLMPCLAACLRSTDVGSSRRFPFILVQGVSRSQVMNNHRCCNLSRNPSTRHTSQSILWRQIADHGSAFGSSRSTMPIPN